MAVTCRIVKATRELIESLMAMDTHNRNKVRSHIEYLKREIRENKYFLTNQGIGVTASGFLADGGHRVTAMWEAEAWNHGVYFLLVEGLDDRAQLYVDRGRARSMSDLLKLFYDTTVSTAVAACVNVLLRAYRAAWRIQKFTPDDFCEMFETYNESIVKVSQVANSSRVRAPILAAVADRLHETQDDRCLEFLSQFIGQEMLRKGDPAYQLFYYQPTTASKGHDKQKQYYHATLYCLDAFLEGRRVTRIMQPKQACGEEVGA
jgi:hypothetical protein